MPMRLKIQRPKSLFILRYVLSQHIQQCLGLLRAYVDSLEIMDGDTVRRGLVDSAEHQEEVPEIDPDLYAVGVILAVFGTIHQLNLSSGLLRHIHSA